MRFLKLLTYGLLLAILAGSDCSDVDGDKWVDSADCAPDDPTRNPGATELCDDIDNDCDGVVDNGLPADAYPDGDGDGYGDASQPHCADGDTISVGGDCNDADPSINPGVYEDCDGVDDDCDGEVDDVTFYTDADGDDYGTGDAITTCPPPSDYAYVAGDCDDASYFVNPGERERCNGEDDDCDGEVDDGLGLTTWYADTDGDGYGDDAAPTSACAAPAGYVGKADDCDDADPAYHPGASESDCTDPEDYNCDGSVGFADADGDGTAACEDCDDANAGAHPGGTEVCDDADVDEDCSGAADDDDPDATGQSVSYADLDDDGYGNPSLPSERCDPLPGHVPNGDDCEDGDDEIYPGAPERCNTFDDDCDGTIDEGLATGFCADSDGDGYGDPATESCDMGWWYVASCDDCDDADWNVHPVATEECNGLDDNCDGTVDEGTTVMLYPDADGDGYGTDASAGYGCAGDPGMATVGGDCDDASATINPGATETCGDGIDDDCDGTADDGCIDYSACYDEPSTALCKSCCELTGHYTDCAAGC